MQNPVFRDKPCLLLGARLGLDSDGKPSTFWVQDVDSPSWKSHPGYAWIFMPYFTISMWIFIPYLWYKSVVGNEVRLSYWGLSWLMAVATVLVMA